MNVEVKIINKSHNDLPEYATEEAAGFDLKADEAATLFPGQTRLIHTNLFMAIPKGYELQIRPRSGIALKQGLVVLNSPGTIDPDYRGEIMIMIHNTSSQEQEIEIGDRIAQGVLNKVDQVVFEEVYKLDETKRGIDGFGSTGKK